MKCKGCPDYKTYPDEMWECKKTFADMDMECLLRLCLVNQRRTIELLKNIHSELKDPTEDWKKGYGEEDAG